jgi:hypothetical protein
VLEIEGEDGVTLTLSHRHDRGVGKPEIKVSEASVDLGCASKQRRRREGDGVLARDQRSEEQASCVPSNA